MKNLSCIVLFFFLQISLSGQGYSEYKTTIDGYPVTVYYKEGDTIVVAELERITITAPRLYTNIEEQRRYLKYRRYAVVVYPYAVQAVRIYNSLMKATEGKSEKEKKKIVKQISERLKDEFEDPLKNMTKTQGFLLTKMIERELDMSFYSMLKEVKGGFSAFYWNEFGKFYGYKLKDRYEEGGDIILDAVLTEFDISYDAAQPDIPVPIKK